MNKQIFIYAKIYPFLLVICLFVNWTALIAQPSGFSDELVSDSWSQAVGLTFDQNGRMYVWEKGGQVWIVENGIRRANPLIDLSEEVGNWRDFGLLGFALDPDFLNNGYIYLWYVVDRNYLLNYGTSNYNPNASSEKEATICRLTRYTAASTTNFTTIKEGSRKILIGQTKANGPPVLHESHGVGHLAFGTDGTLLVSVGDGASFTKPIDEGSHADTYYQQALNDGILKPAQNIGAYRCQTLDNLSGKIVRIDPKTGYGLPSNPFYDSNNPDAPRSKIWSLGVRNPYRLALRSESGSHNPTDGNPGVFLFGDVGWSEWEELNVISEPGQNFGWPYFEGIDFKPGYENPAYRVLENEHEPPKFDFRHGKDEARAYVNGNIVAVGSRGVEGKPFRGNASTGGVWYNKNDFPAKYRDSYFHADYGSTWIRNFTFDDNNNPTGVSDFKLNAGAVVFLAVSPTENGLYYIRYPNQIRRITYTGTHNKKPIAVLKADKTFGGNELEVQFDASESYDPDFSELTYSWNFGDGRTSTSPKPRHTFRTTSSNPKTFLVKLNVKDAENGTSETTTFISLNNTPPKILSTSIDNISTFQTNRNTDITLRATVIDAEHTGQLKYEWQTNLFHNGHQHSEPVDNNISSSATLSPVGCDGSTYWYRITLTVTDPEGLSAYYEKDIYPNCRGRSQTITFNPIEDQSINAGSFLIDAKASSNLPLGLFLLEGPAYIYGNKLVLTGFSGRVRLRATQNGNNIYQPAPPVERSFNVIIPEPADCNTEGFISRDIWKNISGTTITEIPVNTPPDQSSSLNKFEAPANTGNNYGQRIRGFICPPQTGLYTFWLASDNNGELWLSTNAAPANKRLIATVHGGTNLNQWNKYASQRSEAILLVAGSQYYIEALMKEESGGDNLSVGWQLPDNSLDRPISGAYLSPFTTDKLEQTISFFGIPDKLTTDAPFSIGATASSGLPVSFSIVTGPARISGRTITLNETPGVVIVKAKQNGNSQYHAAAAVERSFEVSEAPDLPMVQIIRPLTGNTVEGEEVEIEYALSGNFEFYNANHLSITLDHNNPIDLHTLTGKYTLRNVPIGNHTLKLALTNNNHEELTHSGASDEVLFSTKVEKQNQIISFSPISNKLTTDATFEINATASSSLPISFRIKSGPADISGNRITLIGEEGTVVVAARQFGNASYHPAPVVERSFTVNEPAPELREQTINFFSISNKLTTDNSFTINAPASSGLPVSFRVVSGPASVNRNVVSLNGTPGQVTIEARQAGNSQYHPAPSVRRSFRVSAPALRNQTITFSSISDKLITDNSFTINANASSGLPVSFSVLSGPASINRNVVSLNGTSGQVRIEASQQGNNEYNPAPVVVETFQVLEAETENNASDYCAVNASQPWLEWIAEVKLGDINNTSQKEGYGNFLNQTTVLTKSENYPLTIIPGFSWQQWDEYIRVWIDYNQDGDFEDSNELVLSEIHPAGAAFSTPPGVSKTINIPNTAKEGTTRMRVAMQRASYVESCESFELGEIEDYSIIIETSTTTTKAPQSINFSSIPDKWTTDPPFSIQATATSGLRVSLYLVSGPAIISGNSVTLTGNTGLVKIRATQNGNATYLPAPVVERSFRVNEASDGGGNTGTQEYCEVNASQPWQEWIAQVIFGTINNASSKEGYSNFSNLSTTLEKGKRYFLQVIPGFSWTQWEESIRVWIDYNQDGDFNDSGEEVLSGVTKAGPAQSIPEGLSDNILIPNTALEGTTRMRVMMQNGDLPSACESIVLGEIEDYSVQIVSGNGGTNTKRAQSITFSSIADKFVNDPPFEVRAIASSGLPVAFNIESGPATIVGNRLTLNGTAGIVSIKATQAGNDQYHPAAAIEQTFTVMDLPNTGSTNGEYCESQGATPWQEWIGRVTFSTIDNASGKEGYGDFSNQKARVTKGSSYSISVIPSFSWQQWDEHIRVWIDFNQDGDFTDVGEMVLSGISEGSSPQSPAPGVEGAVHIPTNIPIGETKMRVSMKNGTAPSPCENFDLGEVEDYAVIIDNAASNRRQEILKFTAFTNNDKLVELQWVSNGDWQAKDYIIERSEDNFKFFPILEALPKPDAEDPNFYIQTDEAPLKGFSWYRVKQINWDGSFRYSNAAKIRRAFGLEDFYIFPNPVQDQIFVNLKNFTGANAHIKIYNSYGQLLLTKEVKQITATPEVIRLGHQENGMYYLSVKIGNEKPIGKKFVIEGRY